MLSVPTDINNKKIKNKIAGINSTPNIPICQTLDRLKRNISIIITIKKITLKKAAKKPVNNI